MNTLLANTTNHRRMIMFFASMLYSMFAFLVFYNLPLTVREFIIPPIVGLLIFELLFRTNKWLSLKTLPVYIIATTLLSQMVYGFLYSISYGAGWNPWLSLQSLFEYPYVLYSLIEMCVVTGLAYYLIKIYKNESWTIQEQHTVDKTDNEPIVMEGSEPQSFEGWIQKNNHQIIGFFGWYLIASLLAPISIGLITTPATIIFLLSFAASKNYKGVAGGILVAVGLNFLVSMVRGLSMNAYCFMPFYYNL